MEGTTSFRLNERNNEIARRVVDLAGQMGITPAQLSLAWILKKGVIPIIGASKLSQLEDNLQSLEVNIPAGVMEQLDEVSSIELGFPHDFVLRSGAQKMLYGDMVYQIDGNRNPHLEKNPADEQG